MNVHYLLYLTLFLVIGCSNHLDNTSKKQLVDTRIDLAVAYMKSRNFERAYFHLSRAYKISPNDLRYNLAKIHFFELTKQQDLAYVGYKHLLRSHPNNASVLNNYAMFLCKKKKTEALLLFSKSINNIKNISPSTIYRNAALCAIKLGNKKRAKRYLQQALIYQPDNPELTLLLHNSVID